jgi:signal transduction histidine kinase
MPFLSQIFSETGLTPHGFCLLWQPALIWLHVISDTAIGLSYYVIPLALAYFVWNRRDLCFGWMFWMFAVFILACGTTHFLDVWTLWRPYYGIQGLFKAITAAASMTTAVLLWALVPRLLELPSPKQLRQANEELHKLERQLMHSQKLEALGTLAGGVAHDLNNTLVPILALSKLALDDLPETSPVRPDIETIVRASERARDLVKQILAFSRKQALEKLQVDVALMSREALRMLRASLPASIQIVEQISEVPPVYGNAGELHQVVVNLVTNAAQAIGGGVGNIMVRLSGTAQRQSSPLDEAGPEVCLSIADTGCGMDEATVERVFEPFFTTKAVGDGTGLGLSVVHGIVTRHGGRIAVRSSPGEGSEFTLWLPAIAQPQTTARVDPVAA